MQVPDLRIDSKVALWNTHIQERLETAKAAGYYFKSHGLQALAIETAEACAEWLHRRIREDWGFPDPPEMTMAQRFTSRYRGKRYSFGYPACRTLKTRPRSGNCCARKRSACNSLKAS
jgi:cobalamin-dependent methionine synthase I